MARGGLSRNPGPPSLATQGEGFDDNHHALPDSARMGILRREFDLGWLTIRALESLGLVRDVKAWSRGNAVPRGELVAAGASVPAWASR